MYVGKGSGGRAYQHLKCSETTKLFHRKLHSLLKRGYQPTIKIFPKASEREALDFEETLIAYIGRFVKGDGPLLNIRSSSPSVTSCFNKVPPGASTEQLILMRAKAIEKTSQRVSVNGVVYDSIAKASSATGFSRKTITKRAKISAPGFMFV